MVCCRYSAINRYVWLCKFMARATAWVFTINNYSEDEYQKVLGALSECTYSIVGREVGSGGTPHLQGFCIFPRRHSLSVLKHKLGDRAHLEVARGTAQQNRRYCSKDGDFAEQGECPKRGRKSAAVGSSSRDELAREFVECVARGHRGIAEFAEANPGCWMFNGHSMLRNAQRLVRPISRPSVAAEWVWGEPGVGKSRYAHAKYPEAYIKEPRTKWWNGYLQEEEVIIDDLAPEGIDINHLLRWFDRYPCFVETKGGMTSLHATKFVVTSNYCPESCYSVSGQITALLRRVTVIHME